jgi:vanillate/3-O-methylgallate O-demethylase
MISLCTIDREHGDPGTEVTIVWDEGGDPDNPRIQEHVPKEITARVAPAPYKTDRRRSDLDAGE